MPRCLMAGLARITINPTCTGICVRICFFVISINSVFSVARSNAWSSIHLLTRIITWFSFHYSSSVVIRAITASMSSPYPGDTRRSAFLVSAYNHTTHSRDKDAVSRPELLRPRSVCFIGWTLLDSFLTYV